MICLRSINIGNDPEHRSLDSPGFRDIPMAMCLKPHRNCKCLREPDVGGGHSRDCDSGGDLTVLIQLSWLLEAITFSLDEYLLNYIKTPDFVAKPSSQERKLVFDITLGI